MLGFTVVVLAMFFPAGRQESWALHARAVRHLRWPTSPTAPSRPELAASRDRDRDYDPPGGWRLEMLGALAFWMAWWLNAEHCAVGGLKGGALSGDHMISIAPSAFGRVQRQRREIRRYGRCGGFSGVAMARRATAVRMVGMVATVARMAVMTAARMAAMTAARMAAMAARMAAMTARHLPGR